MSHATCQIDECSEPAYCRGWCRTHYARWHRTGDPRKLRKRPNGTVTRLLELAGSSDRDDCILLSGYVNRPQVNLDGVQMNASRAAWIMAHGDPGEAFVLHTCHQGAEGCINVQHLYLGNQAQNMDDMNRAGRGRQGDRPRRLTDSQVREIRRRHMRGVNHIYTSNTVALAKEFGVSKTTIVNIVARRSRRSVRDDDADQAIARLAAELGADEVGAAADASGA